MSAFAHLSSEPAPDNHDSPNPAERLGDLLRGVAASVAVHASTYEGSHPVQRATAGLRASEIVAGDLRWSVTCTREDSGPDWEMVGVDFTMAYGAAANAAVGIELAFQNWSTHHYLLMPAAVYNGNRYEVHPSWRSDTVGHRGPRPSVMVTPGVPRLNVAAGDSRISLLSSDLSMPGVGIHFPDLGKGMLLLIDDRTSLGLSGIAFEENAARNAAVLRLTMPGVREDRRYDGSPSIDKGAAWRLGERVSLRLALHVFDAARLQVLYDRLFDFRNQLISLPEQRDQIPFSATWAIQHRKYNEQNWVEKYGYYSVGMRESAPQDWQTGWVGGLNTSFALLAEGDELTRRRVIRNLDFVFDGATTPSGFLKNWFHEGAWNRGDRVFLRHSADGLFFLLKNFRLLRTEGETAVPEPWQRRTRDLADAFCRLWERYGEFGQYALVARDDLSVGGTCAASTAIGGLALASRFFDDCRYFRIACEAGRYYHRQFVSIGLTNGGPGDIIQSPDSESCFGLLESFVTLYELTGDPEWLSASRDVAHQCATWVTNHNFAFPANSTFGRLGMLTNGTVWANVQNKHASPGICSLSGLSLLKLARATGDWRYLDLLADIAHAIPQFMSRRDRPIADRRPGQRWPVMPEGWINERVNISDWEVRGNPDGDIGVGEIFGGSTWAEVAMMLTWAEVPGIYWQPDTGLVRVLDHVEAEVDRQDEADGGDVGLVIRNTTQFAAEVKVLCEPASASHLPLDGAIGATLPRVMVPAGASTRVSARTLWGSVTPK